MSFFMEMNGTKISSVELLREYLDVEVLLSYRDRFDQWLYGWDYEDESDAVADLDEGLSDDEWLLAVAEILDIPKERLVKKTNVETSQEMEYDEDDIESVYDAACAGNMEAQYDLGRRYYYGEDIEQDYKEAKKWYQKAADQGHEKAQKRLKKLVDILKKEEVQGQFEEIDCNGVKLELVKIKAGSFIMGSPEDEEERYDDEQQHRVTLTKDYWLGKYQVTQAQYEAIMGKNPSDFKGSNRPVEQVSWYDAKAFCEKLNEQYAGKLPTGYRFDLPTEAQWEYACHAGTTTAFSYGNDSDVDKMNFDGNYPYGDGEEGIYREETVDVGSLGYKNAWGLYDMHGNVWEWCRDWYDSYPGDVTDPAGPSNGSDRVIRGGCWRDFAEICRSASRCDSDPSDCDSDLGFRLALVPVQYLKKEEVQGKFEEIDCNGVKLELVKIKAGSFMMGSPEDEEKYRDDEQQHRVTLTKDFWLGKYQVTQAQYEAIMGKNPSGFKGSNRPVEKVSWYDAKAFCEKLNQQYAGKLPKGYQFDLPTEAQWEYACRAGTTTAFSYGDDSDVDKMNFDGNYPYGDGEEGIYREETVDVGSLGYKNAWGLYDMHGNVNEWCRDWYGDYPGDVTDPTGPSSGSYRMNRGGCWDYSALYCRSAFRSNGGPSGYCSSLGFRLALVPVQ